jgi:PIN domain nuclease of toxin-antitoxin system
VRLLLDTQTWLWMQAASKRLGTQARDLIMNPTNELLLSAASSWEIAIKYRLGKLPLPTTPDKYVPSRMRSSGTQPLPITPAHTLRVAELPDHHGDPFDRLLIAQAQLDGLTILTSDHTFAKYDVPVRWTTD